jgi:signal transduction histidine kinase
MLSLQQLDLLSQQQELQQCALEQNQASLTIQEKETALRQDQLNLVNKENEIKTLALKREKLTKNYMFTGIGLLTLLSLVVYNNFKTRQQLKLQTLRNKIASDLHDDVGSTLSSIHIFSEMARNQSKEVLPMLDTISESSKKMMDAMADIVWTINPENDNFEKIMDRMRSFAYELLLARKIDFEFDAKESLNDLKLSMEARKNLYLIFKEATNNMVKYSNADKAHFSLTEAEKMLTMIIHDNGKGFDMQSASSGNGLRNMKKRAEEIGGALRIDSSPGDGTTIQLSVAV